MGRFDDMENRELQVITTIGEDGEEVKLKLLDIVTVNDFDYALLLPFEADVDADEDEAEVILMRLKQDAAEYVFETIEDDEEFNLVAEAILEEEGYEDTEEE